MPRLKNALDVTPAEQRRIQDLFVQGVRIADIVRRTHRSEAVIYRAVRGLKRPRPHPPATKRARNLRIVALVVRKKLSLGVVARRFRLTKTAICQIVREHLGLRQKKPPKSANVTVSRLPKAPTLAAPALTVAQTSARDRAMVKFFKQGTSIAALARRYALSRHRVCRILDQRGVRDD